MVKYITLGYDCSPAATLRTLNLRESALPFDWVVSSIKSLEKCFENNFQDYHKNLQLNSSKTRLVDTYGFEFPHDYPTIVCENKELVGEGVIGENQICDDWIKYNNVVLEKYERRITRFKSIMQSHEPIIILCRQSIENVALIKQLIHKYYMKTNVFIVNSCRTDGSFENVLHINTEKHNIWNDSSIWNDAICNIKALNNL